MNACARPSAQKPPVQLDLFFAASHSMEPGARAGWVGCGLPRCSRHAEKTLGAVAYTAQAVGVECETVHVEHEHPYRAIIDTAESKGCDLIIMASHGRHGISAIILGSETVKVLTHSKIPVLVHR
jgi:hypothetical protein